MRILYLDLNNGITWQMMIGAMIKLSAHSEGLKEELSKLGLDYEYDLCIYDINQLSVPCCYVDLIQNSSQIKSGKAYENVRYIICVSNLSDKVKLKALKILDDIKKISGDKEYHIIPITAAAILIDMLHIDEIKFSALNIGSDPILHQDEVLLDNIAVFQEKNYDMPIDELGIKILKCIGQQQLEMPVLKIIGIGCGYGIMGRPLRAILFEDNDCLYKDNFQALNFSIEYHYNNIYGKTENIKGSED